MIDTTKSGLWFEIRCLSKRLISLKSLLASFKSSNPIHLTLTCSVKACTWLTIANSQLAPYIASDLRCITMQCLSTWLIPTNSQLAPYKASDQRCLDIQCLSTCSIGINQFCLVELVGVFCVLLEKNIFGWYFNHLRGMFANIEKNIFLHDVSTFPKCHYQVIEVIKEVKLYSIIILY